MAQPKVSVIVPVYNVEKYLSRCMDSLLKQTLKGIEIILVDDGSADNCPVICDEYARQDSRVKVIHKQNEGLGFARNSGIKIATGEYIAFVDSDDYVDVTMYETLYRFAEIKGKADSVSCGFFREIAGNKFQRVVDSGKPIVFENKEDINGVILDLIASEPHFRAERKYELSAWATIFKKTIIDGNKIRFYSERELGSEDIVFKVDFWKYASSIAFIPETFYVYCLNISSLTQTFKPEKYERFKKLYDVLHDRTKDFDTGKLRVNRFFIGYTRGHIFNLMVSELDKYDRITTLRDICNDNIWETIKKEYPARYLPVMPRVIYLCICRKWINLLYYITLAGGLLKQRIKR